MILINIVIQRNEIQLFYNYFIGIKTVKNPAIVSAIV